MKWGAGGCELLGVQGGSSEPRPFPQKACNPPPVSAWGGSLLAADAGKERENTARSLASPTSPAQAAHPRLPRNRPESRNRRQDLTARGHQGVRLGQPSLRGRQPPRWELLYGEAQAARTGGWPRRGPRPSLRMSRPPRLTTWLRQRGGPWPSRTPAKLWAPELSTS